MIHRYILLVYVLYCIMCGYSGLYTEEEEVAMRYSDLFPGYPDHLMMPRDLANFVSSLHVYALLYLCIKCVNMCVCSVRQYKCRIVLCGFCLSTKALI